MKCSDEVWLTVSIPSSLGPYVQTVGRHRIVSLEWIHTRLSTGLIMNKKEPEQVNGLRENQNRAITRSIKETDQRKPERAKENIRKSSILNTSEALNHVTGVQSS